MALHCTKCGAEIVAGSAFCHRCGEKLAATEGGAIPPNTNPASAAPKVSADSADKTAPGTASRGDLGATPFKAEPRRQEPEKDIWVLQFSPRGMIASWIVVGLIAAACIVAAYGWGHWWTMIGLILLACLVQQCRYWYLRFNNRYRLTNYRLLQETGIISRTVNRVELIDVEDIQLHRNLVERMVGIGTILVLSKDVSHPKLRISGVDRPEQHFDMLEQAMRVEKRRREFHIESG